MLQKAIPSTTLAAAVRTYLGMSQEQLATLLEISRGQVAHVEAGRRQLRDAPSHQLRELALLLPPPLGSAAATEPAELQTPPPPARNLLRRRLVRCEWQAANLRHKLARLQAHEQLASRLALLPALREALPSPTTYAHAARQHQLLNDWAMASPLPLPDLIAAKLLMQLRLQFLEAKVAALSELLAVAV